MKKQHLIITIERWVRVCRAQVWAMHISACGVQGGENLCVASWNQHIPIYCGACWAHGALSMIQDRLKIRKKGANLQHTLYPHASNV